MRSALSGIIKAAQYPLTLSAIMDVPPLHAVCIAMQRHWLVVGIPPEALSVDLFGSDPRGGSVSRHSADRWLGRLG